MRITDIEWKDGNEYVDDKGRVWIVKDDVLRNENYRHIMQTYGLKEITQLNFTIQTDWSKVENDDNIWINYDGLWSPRHFAYYDQELNIVKFYGDGRTSHTTTGFIGACDVEFASLTKPKG